MIMERQRRVMFVDDEEGVRQSWDRLLTAQGFAVSTAADGALAEAELEQEAADVVVADLRMPRVDGLELLEWIRERQPQTRFILVTGYGSDAVEQRARELGAYGYLHKPVNPETLSAVITSALQVDLGSGAAGAPGSALATVEVPAPSTAAVRAAPPLAVEPSSVELPVAKKSRVKGALQIVGGLVVAPIAGLAFVLFLPLIGFGGLFWSLGEAIWKRVGASRA
jgi:DNA-binding response OmpR family regulator